MKRREFRRMLELERSGYAMVSVIDAIEDGTAVETDYPTLRQDLARATEELQILTEKFQALPAKEQRRLMRGAPRRG